MFDYPVFEVPIIGQRLLMAIDAVTHVFVSHGGAVGGSVVLALAAWWANKKNDLALYELVRKILMVFFIVTTSVGALTGIGIWIHANIITPNGIGSLIRVFFWKWFIEWIVFNIEVIMLMIWFMTWEKNAKTEADRKKSIMIGGVYAVSSWVTMLIITAILGFMLTPNFEGQPWIDPEVFPGKVDYNNALFNPTWFPGLAMRTFSAIAFGAALAILWTWLLTAFFGPNDDEAKELRGKAIRFFATIMVVAVPIGAVFGFIYLRSIPESAMQMIPTAMMTRAFADRFDLIYTIVAAIGVTVVVTTLLAFFLPKRMPYVAAVAMVLAFASFWGYEERVREFVRKPFIINNYMFANGIRLTDIPYLNRVGVLKHAVFFPEEERVLKADRSNIVDVGRSVYRIECKTCHTTHGLNSLSALTQGWTREAIHNRVSTLRSGTTLFMPDFVGTEAEKEALVEFILSLNAPGRYGLTAGGAQ